MSDQTEAEGALAAMKRAAETARQRALRCGTRLAIWKDGKVVLVSPEEFDSEREPDSPESHGEELAERRSKIERGDAKFISEDELKRRLRR